MTTPRDTAALATCVIDALMAQSPKLSVRGMGVVFRIALAACEAQIAAEEAQRMNELVERQIRMGQR